MPDQPETPKITYILRKVSRSGTSPYAGPSCENAGVPPGKVYTSYNEALVDCQLLNAFGSPVGFSLITLVNGKELDEVTELKSLNELDTNVGWHKLYRETN